MRFHPLFLSILLVSFSTTPLLASAQEESGSGTQVEETASGRTLREMLDDSITLLSTEGDITPTTVRIESKILSHWKAEAFRLRQRQVQNRIDCGDAIRRANRDTLMTTATRCVRNDILLEAELLREQQKMLEKMPIMNAEVFANLQESLANFDNASLSIINAIDAGLFQKMDTIRQATRNLHSQYRQILQKQYTLQRIERERTWIHAVASKIRAYLTSKPDSEPQWKAPVLCLEEAAISTKGAENVNYTIGSREHLSAIRTKNTECRILMNTAISAIRTSEEPQE